MRGLICVSAVSAALLSIVVTVHAGASKEPTTRPYPLKTCVVSDRQLGEMGPPHVIQHQGKEVRLCCNSCEGKFNKDPEKYLKKLDQAENKAPATQPSQSSEQPQQKGEHAGHGC